MLETNKVPLRNCVVGQEYITFTGKRIRIMSKEEERAKIYVLPTSQEQYINYEQNMIIRTNEGQNILVKNCVVGQEYLDDYGAKVKIVKKDKQSVRVADLDNGEERDLAFTYTYCVSDLIRPHSEQTDDSNMNEEYENELNILKDRIKELEGKNKKLTALLEEYKQEEKENAIPVREDIEYEEEESIEKPEICEQEISVDENAVEEKDDVVDKPIEKVTKRRGRKPKAKEVVEKKQKAASNKVESKKQFIVRMLKKGVQTRESLAEALIKAGMVSQGNAEKLKGYISVIIYDIEKKDGMTIKRPSSGKYLIE